MTNKQDTSASAFDINSLDNIIKQRLGLFDSQEDINEFFERKITELQNKVDFIDSFLEKMIPIDPSISNIKEDSSEK
jgi:hypothetical protein